ncbi:ABC transporter permease [uncultured Paludibaculum sp.]|uniref:ABC transporter permease n=1 Tax=uncultured Paludibaculum sp. TaxID=1765020 RepID=UPI002AAA7FEC|nr:ABC transporter permease [uncultured Paludibaculum sp.]
MWRRLFHRQAADAELEEELDAHRAIEAKQLMDAGEPRERAEALARRQLGNQALIMELTRESWGWAGLARLWQDAEYTVRALRRQPVFTAAAVLSLALGIAASTAVFSIADTIFLRPLPYADAGRLMWTGVSFPSIHAEFLPSPDFVAWRRDNRVFEQLAASQANQGNTVLLRGPDTAEVHSVRVSANFLDTLGVTPALGRTFTTHEELPNGPKSAILTHHCWSDHFQSRRDVVGSQVELDSQAYTVVGVLPASFVYPADTKVDLLTTLPIAPSASHRDRGMATWAVFGRLKTGVTWAQARADVERLFAASKADDPRLFRTDNRPLLEPLSDHRAGNAHTALFVLMGAAGFLLAIACANVANLLMARWSARSQELAIRAALGAGRARLARQLFTEVAVLIVAGAGGAMMLVTVALGALARFGSRDLPRLGEIAVDFRVFAVALLVSLTAVLLVGAFPVLRAGAVDLQSVLQWSPRAGVSGGRLAARRALVAVEVALSVILLSGAALLFQTLWHLQNDRLGFQPEHMLSVSLPLYGAKMSNSARDALAAEIVTELRRMPGTEAAAVTQCTPLAAGVSMITFSRSDRPLPEPFHRGDNVGVCGAGPDYLRAAGTRLVQGRFFTDSDFQRPGTLAVINESAVRAYFPGESAIGKQILGGRANTWKSVVGVVADTKNQGLNRLAVPQAFVNDTSPVGGSDLLFLVRTLASAEVVGRTLRDGLRTTHPGLLLKTETLDQLIGQLSASPRFHTLLLSAFAALAFLIALIGIYGVLSFSVMQRRQEIGIRMALGATPGIVLRQVIREGAVFVSAGTLAGIAGSLVLTRTLATLLYGVRPNDPATYAAVMIGMAMTAAAASLLPARKAAALDPAVAVRHE